MCNNVSRKVQIYGPKLISFSSFSFHTICYEKPVIYANRTPITQAAPRRNYFYAPDKAVQTEIHQVEWQGKPLTKDQMEKVAKMLSSIADGKLECYIV